MDKKVILTVGIQGSGKTTWAKKYQEENAGTVILERDVLRENIKPGYYKGKPNKAIERQVTEDAKLLLSEALKNDAVNTVIISDTNLNSKTLINLEKQIGNKAEIIYEIFEDSKNLELCLQRNRNRQKRVPDEIVIKFWKTYMSQYESDPFESITKPLLFVGDIHSQYHKLKLLLNHFGTDTYHFVFLGDINDSRISPDKLEGTDISFLKVYKAVRQLVEDGKATLIHSNHQKNLINAIRRRRKKASWGLGNTLMEMEQAGLMTVEYGDEDNIKSISSTQEASDIANWLDSRPYYFKRGNLIGVHAQYKPEHCHSPYDVTGRGREALIYGTTIPKTDNVLDNRVHWWEDYTGPEFVIAGHYHQTYIGTDCAVIDAGCGEDGGRLMALDVEKGETIEF